jgi:hypothetical protein
MLRGLLGGLGLGILWGGTARAFMRLLADDPEFSWSGTLFILGIGAVAGAAVGLVHGARVRGRSRWWRLAALPALLVFFGQGALLLPSSVGMAVVLRGGTLARPVGAALVAVSPVALVLLADPLVVTRAAVAGIALMTLSTVPLGWGIGEVARRWRPRTSAVREAAADPAPARWGVAAA